MNVISVAVIDDHPLITEGIAALMQRKGGFIVVAKGSAAEHIAAISEAYHPDAMIVDLSMPGDVFQAISDTVKVDPELKIVVFTASTSTTDAIHALDAGASGYVLKGSPADDLLDAIVAARRGEIYITPSLASKVLSALRSKAVERRAVHSAKLNVREEQIIQLLLCGKLNREIACALSLSEKTVKSYMTNLMQKLNCRNRLEAVIAAQRLIPQAQEARDMIKSN